MNLREIADMISNTNISDLLDEFDWKTKKIDYAPPVVDRIYTDLVEDGVSYRFSLHKIYPCDRALYHPHPWPSLVRSIGWSAGTYEMGVGFGPADGPEPPLCSTIWMPTGSRFEYDMLHPQGWHYVKVTGGPSYTIMVTGPVWNNGIQPERRTFRELTTEEQRDIWHEFQIYQHSIENADGDYR